MFDVFETIEEGYLWNFSPMERAQFKAEHRCRQASLMKYQGKLAALVATDSPAIFANDDPHSSTSLEIKYTFNRLHLNDPRETELCLSRIDPPSPRKVSYAQQIAWAFEDNTFCNTVALDGVRVRDGWLSRGFNDAEAGQIIDALADKKLETFSFTHYPLLTDITYLKIANTLHQQKNHWSHVMLGSIAVADDIADSLSRTGKVSFTRIERKAPRTSLLSRFLGRERFE